MAIAASSATPASARTWSWPVPPYFHAAGSQPIGTAGAPCSVELLDGRTVKALIADLQLEQGWVCIAVNGLREHWSLDQVRCIRLTVPQALVRDDAAIAALGGSNAEMAEPRPFNVQFRDGFSLKGSTLGFVREDAGLFLYQPEAAGQVMACFIPAQHIGDMQIGPPIGEALQKANLVDAKGITAAVRKQAQLRDRKLGEQLVEDGVIAPDALKQMLRQQKTHPATKLGEVLVEAELITPAQLAQALKVQAVNRARRLGDILIEMGLVTIRQLQKALAAKLGIPFVNVREFPVDPLILESFNLEMVVRCQALPLLRMEEALVVAVANPLEMDCAQELRFLSGRAITPVIADPDELRQRIVRELTNLNKPVVEVRNAAPGLARAAAASERGGDLARIGVAELAVQLSRESPQAIKTKDGEAEARVNDNALVRLLNKIIMDAHAQGASDIHIECNAGAANTRVRFRKDGDLEDYLELPPIYRNALVSRIKVMAELDISEHRRSQDGKIDFAKFGSLPIELRVAVVPTANNLEDVVLRILGGVEPLPLEQLGLNATDHAELMRMASRSYGLILVCGPTGSGKTTTLHSLLHQINRPDLKIWTAEDPVEIVQPGLRQVQVNLRVDWTFAAAMRAFLRADPDVIMVGELRDAETIKIGIEASLTGHLVFSTLHTNSAAESVVRLLDMGMDPFNFADAMIGVLSQRLARKLCPKCKRSHRASDAELGALAQEYCAGSGLEPAAVVEQWRSAHGRGGQVLLHEAVGCKACREGYKGRTGIYELLRCTDEIKQLVRTRGSVPQLLQVGQAAGMRLLRQDAIEKVLDGILDLKSARAACS